MTSAESLLAANSKLEAVRVEDSKKRFTTVRPRSVGSFFTSRCWTSCIDPAVSRMVRMSCLSRSFIDNKERFTGLLR